MCSDGAPNDLYTETQKQYVAGLPDDPEILKDHLLHQIRLRDNLRRDRDNFEKQNNELSQIILDARSSLVLLRAENPDAAVFINNSTTIKRIMRGDVL